jgi:hypothetical protein
VAEITLVIGSGTRCADDKLPGELKHAVVDDSTRAVTHVVVEPRGRVGLARIVPLDAITDTTGGTTRLRYTEAEFKQLRPAEESLAELTGYGEVELLPAGWSGADDEAVVDGSTIPPIRGIVTQTRDFVPPGEEEESSGDHLHATDGDIGELRAICVDAGTHEVTHLHVLLTEHLLGHKEVAVPSGSVSGFRGGIHLTITRQQVRDLAHADIDHPTG